MQITLVILSTMLWLSSSSASPYKEDERVVLYVNKVVPYHSPFAMYDYYTLPLCQPEEKLSKSLTLAEILDGDRLTESQYVIRYLKNVQNANLCQRTLTANEVSTLYNAVMEYFYYEFELDGVIVRGYLGHRQGTHLSLWNHLHFEIEYNDGNIIFARVDHTKSREVNLDTMLKTGGQINFSYSVSWKLSQFTFEERWKRQQEDNFFPKSFNIHWNSLRHSFIVILLLVIFVWLLVRRVLRRDFDRYNLRNSGEKDTDELEEDLQDDGWKLVHGDVFRIPSGTLWLSAFVGVGVQLLAVMAILALLFAMSESYRYLQRHSVFTTSTIFAFFLSQCVAGYLSTWIYLQLEEHGRMWVRNANLAAGLFTVPTFCVWSVVNTMAWVHQSTLALPVTTIILLIALGLFLGFPLSLLGSIVARSCARQGPPGLQAPCRTRIIPREIPTLVWFKRPMVHALLAGFVQFSSISLELYYLIALVWVRHHADFHWVLAAIFLKVIIVCTCVSVVFTYLQLAAEDYRWWWRSIQIAMVSSLFIMAYATYFLLRQTHMKGVLQLTQYFGGVFLLAFIFFSQFSAVGFLAALTFVKYIYRSVKLD